LKSRIERLILLVGCLLAAVPAAGGGPGTPGATGLTIPSGARPSAMGGAFTGMADDLNALTWNPAGLGLMGRPELSVLHSDYLVDTRYEMVGYAQPLSGLGTLGAAVSLLDYGTLPRQLEQTNGLPGALVGTTVARDVYLTAGWGGALLPVQGLDRIKVGANLKFTSQRLSQHSFEGFGVSAGALWDTPLDGVRAGTLVDNLGAVTGHGSARTLPLGWVIGGSWAHAFGAAIQVAAALDARIGAASAVESGVGAEVTTFDLVSLRAGWRGGADLGGPTFGLGLRTPATFLRLGTVAFDYAMVPSGDLGSSQRFEMSVRFGGRRRIILFGSLKVRQEQGGPVLAWAGQAAAWLVLVKGPRDEKFTQLTDRPVTETSYPLPAFPSGAYIFKVVPVDPDLGSWSEDDAVEIEVSLDSPQEAPTSVP